MPGGKYFTETVIPQMYTELKTTIMSTLETVTAVSLVVWTCSHNNESFISFTCHSISDDFKQQPLYLKCKALFRKTPGADWVGTGPVGKFWKAAQNIKNSSHCI
jgi:hypothetical protein